MWVGGIDINEIIMVATLTEVRLVYNGFIGVSLASRGEAGVHGWGNCASLRLSSQGRIICIGVRLVYRSKMEMQG